MRKASALHDVLLDSIIGSLTGQNIQMYTKDRAWKPNFKI
jgi:hypothetical protein